MSDSRKVVQVTTDDHGFSLGYDADNGLYTLVDLTRFYLVSKADLGKFLTASGSVQAKEGSYITVTSIKLPAGHTYLVIGSNQVSKNLTSVISSQLVGFNSTAETYSFYLGDSRTTGTSGGGCLCAAIVSTKAECTISLKGYGYSSGTYDYIGKLFAIQLA